MSTHTTLIIISAVLSTYSSLYKVLSLPLFSAVKLLCMKYMHVVMVIEVDTLGKGLRV